jgi:hypothetical protein
MFLLLNLLFLVNNMSFETNDNVSHIINKDHLHWRHLLAKPSATATHNSHLGRCDSTCLGQLWQRDKK